MSKRRKLGIALTSVVVLLIGAGGGWSLYRRHAARTLVDVLPSFREPGPGPRASETRALGFEVGVTSLAAASARLRQAGLDCPDTSMRGLMAVMRAEKKRELEAVKARGGDVDTVSGASMIHRRSPKEANPQVKLACADVAADLVEAARTPTATGPVRGRLLLIFDSAAHPLRHVSFERVYPAARVAAALADFSAARAVTSEQHGDGRGAPAAVTDLPWLAPVEVKWSFADLEVRLAATNWGPRGIVVSEIVEVPWPVRADAPARTVAHR